MAGTLEERIALARGMSEAPTAEPEPEAEATEDSDAEGSEEESTEEKPDESEGESSEGAEGEPEESTEEEEDEDSADGSDEPLAALDEDSRGALVSLLKKGVADLAEALGEDPKEYRDVDKRFAAIGRREGNAAKKDAALKEAQNKLVADSAKLAQKQRTFYADQRFLGDAKKAWDDGDTVAPAKAVERLFGTDIATFTQRLAEGPRELTPTEKRLREDNERLRRANAEKAATEAAKKAETEKPDRDLAEREALGKARMVSALGTHPYVASDEDAAEEVFAAWKESWDGERFTKTPKQIADELHEKAIKRAERLGLKKVKRGKKKARGRARAQPAEPPPTPKNGEKPASRLGIEDRIAMARRMTDQAHRGVRG